jgi:hypothetical protein
MTINFIHGASYVSDKTKFHYYVIAVRGGKSQAKLVKNSDGTVTVKDTGLMWNGVLSSNGNWADSVSFWANQTSCGYSDWRLPTEAEVSSLLDILASDSTLSLGDYFTLTNLYSAYWSYTLSTSKSGFAIDYSLSSEQTGTLAIATILDSLGVRGTMMSRFIVNSDGTVFDKKTGLMWLENDGNNATKMSFKDALTYCNNLTYAGYSDWRMPSRNELLSLLDAAMNTWDVYIDAFPDSSSLYWTSSSSAALTEFAWQVDFTENTWGITLGNYYTQYNAVRAVRGGNL